MKGIKSVNAEFRASLDLIFPSLDSDVIFLEFRYRSRSQLGKIRSYY